MTAHIIDGKSIAARVLAEVRSDAENLRAATGMVPGLVVILVGENPASEVYVRNKRKACLELGWFSEIHLHDATVSQTDIEADIDALNADPRVHGILLQLPLPAGLDEQALLERIKPEKDVDGFHPVNVGKLALGLPAPVPCTPLGIQRMLAEERIETRGRFAVVVGRSHIVGKPVAQLLLRKGPGGDATVCVAHSRTPDLPDVVRRADIVVAAIGQPLYIKGDWIKPGATVIDVGMNRIADPSKPKGSRLVGDVDFDAAVKVAGAITPVPGGVGLMTIAMLMHNTLECARRISRPAQ